MEDTMENRNWGDTMARETQWHVTDVYFFSVGPRIATSSDKHAAASCGLWFSSVLNKPFLRL